MNIRKRLRNPIELFALPLAVLFLVVAAMALSGPGSLHAQPGGKDDDTTSGRSFKKFKIRNLGFVANTEDLEYAPTVTADGKTLYFVSDRPGGVGGHDFWYVTKNDRLDSNITKPVNLGKPVNTELNEGVASIAADGQTIYFTGCERADGLGDCDIYEAELDGNQWRNIRNVQEINSPYWDSQPSISSDGKTLYFVSNRPGAMGGDGDADIYVSTKGADGKWSKPRNMGAPINTSEREDSPFILAGGKELFFSSSGHGGQGGLDFFSSSLGTDGKWSTPENLGEPVNTSQDERFITMPAAGDIIYFSSERRDIPNSGKLDIFEGRRPPKIINVLISGRVYDRCTNGSVPAEITFVSVDSTGNKDTVYQAKVQAANGTYSFVMTGGAPINLQAVGTSPGYPKISESFSFPATKKYAEFKHDFPVGATPVLAWTAGVSDWVKAFPDSSTSRYKKFRGLVIQEYKVTELYPLLTYVFFDSGSSKIDSRYIQFENLEQTNQFDDSKIPGGTFQKYYQMLNIVGFRMRKFPETRIKIQGCNSKEPGIGEVKSVSTDRSQVIYDYLTKVWQIDAGRITQLPARDLPEHPSNTHDPMGIIENRRVEIIVDDPAGKGWEIVKPILQVDLRLTSEPDTMHFQMKNGISDALVAKRAIEIRRKGEMWHVMSNIGKTEPVSPAYNWGKSGNEDELPKNEEDYVAQLVIYSADGKECRSNEVHIPVVFVTEKIRRIETGADKTIDRLSLVLFKYDSPEAGDLNNRILREYIYPRVVKGVKIDVTGYTDIVGLDDRNLKLSRDRAATVTNGIRKNVKPGIYDRLDGKGVGETAPLYDNSLPEGRFYNRTVQVVIETPITVGAGGTPQ